MAVYNSSVGLNQDDSDITIINPSIIHESNDDYVNNTYVPIVTRLRQANNSSENRQTTNSQSITTNNNQIDNSNGQHEYIIVDHNPQESAKQLEQVLMFYLRDLKQEKKPKINCVQLLVTRLMDLIRPAYPNDQKKMIELDQIMSEIACLHDKQHIENEEKLEQLRTEISQLRKMLYTTTHDQLIYNDHSRTSSMFGTTHEEHKAKDYEQWTEIEDDAKKLHELIQSQKNQINEIVSLVSQTATASTSLNTTDVSIDNSKDAVADRQTLTTTNTNLISNLLKKIHNITGQQEPTITTTSHETILENHSPGISPTSSMATLTLTSLNQIRDNPPPPLPQIEDSSNQQVNNEEPHTPIDIPLPPPPPSPPAVVIEPKKCPICNHEFELTCSDADMYEHIEKCLYSPMANTEPQPYECPNCNRKYPGDDETAYLQHLSDCYNRDIAGDFE
ncbi:unnamed protein product [Adineta steineri]|uniref:Uncharacterized protein n=1 Tax=Adineta steineri TaxID=433720 RepID=A0A819K3G7_9BILA|nr:unnamed protein product [Adineta steineri]CAF3477348.1 unnamed protein product [Adineta steineri]CAF3939258.1 unnamed protein product [Adineta steineri]